MKKQIIFLSMFVALVALVCVTFMRFGGQNTGGDTRSLPTVSGTDIPIVKGQSGQKTTPATNATNMPTATAKLARDLVAGGRRWKLHFADQSLSPETQQRISYDLNLIYGHLPETVIDTLPMPLEVDGRQLDRRVRFEGEGRKWNKVLQSDEFGCLFRGAGETGLYVPRSVIDAYRKAIELETRNQAAYQQLDQFLGRMTALKERPIENVRELFVLADDFKSAEADLAAMPADGFAKGWGGKVYRSPSILDVSPTGGTPFEKYGSLLATTYAISAGRLDELPRLVYDHGQWRFLLERPPT